MFINTYHFLVTFIVPIPMGITVVSVPITTVLPLTLSPFLWYYHNFRPHYHSFTVVTADLPLSSSPCSSLVTVYSGHISHPTPTPGTDSPYGE